MVDQLRSAIEKALIGPLDGLKFQKCATELLGEIYPSLVLTSGSHDFGRDGVIAHLDGQNHILTCTTSDRVLENLRKSLKSFLATGAKPGLVTVATSARVTARKRNNLEREAQELGFLFVQAYDQTWFSRQLYRDASWREELLGVSGQPAALSTFPRTRRPHIQAPLVGRENQLDQLRRSQGDLILYGKPGVGKTFLLQELVDEGWGLFLVDSNKEALANAIRSESPARIIIDDAHFAPDLLEDLKHLRTQLRATYSIVATSWPEWTPDISGALIGADQIELPLLTRDQVLAVIEHCGIRGPRELQKHIVDQARGRPGLAATLSLACLTGGIESVWRGELLLKDVFGGLGAHSNEEQQGVYAVLALGGDAGVDITDIARCLDTSIGSVLACVRDAASAGTLESVRGAETSALVVQPEVLRFAIVAEYFFNPTARLPLTSILQKLPEPARAVIPLIALAHRGHAVDRSLILNLLKEGPSKRGIIGYAALGSAETETALSEFPHLERQIAEETLSVASGVSLRSLLEAANGDERPRNSATDHPLRIIRDYAHSLSNRVSNRRNVLDAVRQWLEEGGVPDVAVEALAAVVDPATGGSWTDPGAGNQVTISRGMVPADEITELEHMWEEVLELVTNLDFRRFGPILEAWESWVWPSRLMAGSASVPEREYKQARQVARRIAINIRDRFGERPGIMARLKRTNLQAGLRVRVDLPGDFEVLFPSKDQPDGEFAIEKHYEMERRQQAKARRLGKLLTNESPDAVIERLMRFEREADVAGLNKYPHMTPVVLEEIALLTNAPASWLATAEQLSGRGSAWLFAPFCDVVLSQRRPGWHEQTKHLLASENLNQMMALACLKKAVPDDILKAAVSRCQEMHSNLIAFQARLFTKEAKLLLLTDGPVSLKAALVQGLAMDTPDDFTEAEHEVLLGAVASVPADDWWIPTLLGRHPAALKSWLLNWANRVRDDNSSYESVPREMLNKVGELPLLDRCEVLKSLPEDVSVLSAGEVVDALVGADVETTKIVFARVDFKGHREATIGEQMDELWVGRAEVALSYGMSPKEIMIAAAYPSNRLTMWQGDESGRWRIFMEKSKRLMTGPSETHKVLGACGLKLFEEQEEKAKQKEHEEAVFGGSC